MKHKLLWIGLAVATLTVVALTIFTTSCSRHGTGVEENSVTMSLSDARFEYGAELLARDSTDGVYINVYQAKEASGVMVAVFKSTDSCVVFLLDQEGNMQAVTKPLSGVTSCLIRGVAMCQQLHGTNDSNNQEYANCVAKVITQCSIMNYLFGWLCSNK